MTRVLAVMVVLVTLAGMRGSTAIAAPTAAELDSLLAPVALYPDQLLGEMLVSAQKPAMVGVARRMAAQPDGARQRAAGRRRRVGFRLQLCRAGALPRGRRVDGGAPGLDGEGRRGVRRRPFVGLRQHPAAPREGEGSRHAEEHAAAAGRDARRRAAASRSSSSSRPTRRSSTCRNTTRRSSTRSRRPRSSSRSTTTTRRPRPRGRSSASPPASPSAPRSTTTTTTVRTAGTAAATCTTTRGTTGTTTARMRATTGRTTART